MKGAIKVATAVSVTDKAIFAFAKYAITFDARPLGEEPIKTTPAAISGEKLKSVASVNPNTGMILN